MAPLYDGFRIDVPRQIYQEAARAQVLGKDDSYVLRSDPLPEICDAFVRPLLQCGPLVLKVDDRYVPIRDLDVLQQNGEGAPRYRAVANDQNLAVEPHHLEKSSFSSMRSESNTHKKSFVRTEKSLGLDGGKVFGCPTFEQMLERSLGDVLLIAFL